MTTFVRLTRPDGKATWVNPDQVCAVDVSVPGSALDTVQTSITLVNTTRFVIEDISLVLALLRNPDVKA